MPNHGFTAIVVDYVEGHRERAAAELAYFRDLPTDEDAVSVAALGEYPRGKRHSHQTRLSRAALHESQLRLLACLPQVMAATSFDELFKLLDTTIGRIPGIGDLAVYDTAVRIGARLGLAPTKIYLHRGTRRGAAALGLKTARTALEKDELPQELRVLEARELEDVLCIYKRELARAARGEQIDLSLAPDCAPGGRKRRRSRNC